MNSIQQARQLIASFYFTEDSWEFLDEGSWFDGKYLRCYETINPEILSAAFHHTISCLTGKPLRSSEPPLAGQSKLGGSPHFPEGWKIPEGMTFIAQLNLAELKASDRENLFPEAGIFYFFCAEDDPEFAAVMYFGGTADMLMMPEATDDHVYPLTFVSHTIFYIAEDGDYGYAQSEDLIPEALHRELETLTESTLTNHDHATRIFGKGTFWQSEDVGYDEDDLPDSGSRYVPGKEEERVLLFQCEFGEGNLHFWIDRNALKAGITDNAYATYSGT